MVMALAHLGLIVFIFFSEFVRKKTKKFDYLTLFNLIFTLCYPLPAFLLGVNLGTSELSLGSKLYTGDIQTTYAIFLGYFAVVAGYYSKSAEKAGSNLCIKTTNQRNVTVLAIFLLSFSFLSIYLYGLQYGGITLALSKTILIRSNVVESGVFVFFKHFMNFSKFASYLLAAYCFSGQLTKTEHPFAMKTILAILLSLSICTSFIASFLSSSRAALIYYLVGFYLAYILKTKKIFSVYTIPSILFVAFFVLFGKAFLFSLSALPNGGFDSALSTFVNTMQTEKAGSNIESSFYQFLSNFSFPLYSLHTALNNSHYDLRLFTDLITAFQSLIPERVFNIQKPQSISDYNTLLMLGNVDYQVPAGILAFGIYSFSWIGLIMVCFIYGWFGRYLDTFLNRHIDDINWVPFIYVLTALTWVDLIPSGDPALSLVGSLGYLIPMTLLLSLCCKVYRTPQRIFHLKS
jgi:oligosaccharide repeat unit polymerase